MSFQAWNMKGIGWPRRLRDVFWLGAHKTGTTYLQGMLDETRPALLSRGRTYITLEDFRSQYTRPLLYKSHPQPPAAPLDDINFVFDENIAGLVQHVLSARGMYPEIAERSLKVASYLGLERPIIYFGVRDYATFLPSLYCETLKSTAYKPFSRFYKPDTHVLDWLDVVQRLKVAFPESPIRIYAYEELRGNERTLLSRATGIRARRFRASEGQERPGFSHKAVRSLFELSKTREVTHEDVEEAVQTYPKGPQWKPFDPLSEQDKVRLTSLYRGHLVEIGKLRDVEVMTMK